MKNLTYLCLTLFLISCQGNKTLTHESPVDSYQSEIETVRNAFFQVDSLLDLDNDAFWNMPLYGPILFVNPENRSFFANQNNENNSFESKNGVFIGSIPNELNLANTAFDWDGMRWTMVMQPLPEDIADRNRLIIHELFHRIQPELGFDLPDLSNNHLDTYEGRVLLKLELEALKNALMTKNERESKSHIRNALFFRFQRYQNGEIKSAENSLEINEGLAEYTAIMLGGRTEDEVKTYFSQSIKRFYANPTFIRSFAYQTTPLYGYLLASTDRDWHKRVRKNTNLTDLFRESFSVEIPADSDFETIAIANNYNYEGLLEEEKLREEKRITRIEEYKGKFLEQPALKIFFQNMSISFDPRNLVPLDDIGTVYPNLRISDNWGILTADSGALLSADWGYLLVSAPENISDSLVTGVGWQLELNEDWKVDKRDDNFELIEKNQSEQSGN